MRKLIAVMNMTLDGVCDHTVGTPDDEMHQHYTDLLRNGGAIIYGRVTYELMADYWPALLEKPSGEKPMDDFAKAIDGIPKVVFSRTLKKVHWESARLALGSIQEEVTALKQEPGKDLFVGSPGLIVSTLNLGLVDELQINVMPLVEGKGMRLFRNITDPINMKLLRTKTFRSGSILLTYEVKNK